MPNELFGSVGFALSADRRRPKTLARRLINKERRRQAAYYQFIVVSWIQFHQSTCDSPGKLTEPQGLSQKRMWDSVRH